MMRFTDRESPNEQIVPFDSLRCWGDGYNRLQCATCQRFHSFREENIRNYWIMKPPLLLGNHCPAYIPDRGVSEG